MQPFSLSGSTFTVMGASDHRLRIGGSYLVLSTPNPIPLMPSLDPTGGKRGKRGCKRILKEMSRIRSLAAGVTVRLIAAKQRPFRGSPVAWLRVIASAENEKAIGWINPKALIGVSLFDATSAQKVQPGRY